MKKKNNTMLLKTSKEMAEQFCLPEHDEFLLVQLREGDKIASTQLLIKYMPDVVKIAKELSLLSNDQETLVAKVITYFLENLSFSYFNHQSQKGIKEPYSVETYLKTIKMEMLTQLRGDKEKIQPLRFNLSQLSSLNKLNSILKKKQLELWTAIDQQITELEARLANEDPTLSNYELKLGIQYYIMKNSHPIHSSHSLVNLATRKEIAKEMNNPHFDWWAKGMPVLEEPYCFLLSQLFEQWHIAHRIPDIVMVWTTIQVEHQSSMLLRDNKWTFITKNDSKI